METRECGRCENCCRSEDGTPFCGITLIWTELHRNSSYCANYTRTARA